MQLSVFFESANALQSLEQHQALAPFWRFGTMATEFDSDVDVLLQSLGIKNVRGEQALANLLLKQEGISLPEGQDAFLVQPVSLMLQRDTIALAEIVHLTKANYLAITELLNSHFAADHISLIQSQSHQYWYLALDYAPTRTVLPNHALHQDVHPYQPTGDGATPLKQMMNEAQMLLHNYGVNHEREAQGLLPVNSIWLSGNGELPSELHTAYDVLIGNSPLLDAMHQQIGITKFSSLIDVNTHAFKHGVMHVEVVEQVDWGRLYQMLKRRKMSCLKLYIPLAAETVVLTLKSIDCLKFWRKQRSLVEAISMRTEA